MHGKWTWQHHTGITGGRNEFASEIPTSLPLVFLDQVLRGLLARPNPSQVIEELLK